MQDYTLWIALGLLVLVLCTMRPSERYTPPFAPNHYD